MKNITAERSLEQAAFFAHEIKNPLAVIKANVQLIEFDCEGENSKCFETIYACIDKINGLISENLEYIKSIENSVMERGSDAVRVIDVITAKYSKICDRRFTVEKKVPAAVVSCRGELLESLFENLIKNAVEATKDGDSVDIEIKTKQGRAVITVADSGCGISDKDIAGMGELFYTTKKGGSGVGLFMCRRIAEQNGGRLKIGHNKPRGTKVTVELKLI